MSLKRYRLISPSSKKKVLLEEVLLEAYKSGYFEWPMKMNLNELSKKFGIGKSTCLHHIRTAEQKILKRFCRGN
ncbi:hypothetical protein DRP07_09225 [Archaeoglobales archaeon]|nr:MAG: hypothetical protein DRP07_09225 [Archaeoglobales archaeon]